METNPYDGTKDALRQEARYQLFADVLAKYPGLELREDPHPYRIFASGPWGRLSMCPDYEPRRGTLETIARMVCMDNMVPGPCEGRGPREGGAA